MLDSADRYHQAAAEFWSRSLDAREDLVTNQLVAIEALSLLQQRHGVEAVRRFRDGIAPVLRIVAVLDDELDRAMLAVVASGKRGVSVVDRACFETMRRLGVDQAFAFEVDFQREGFELIPAASRTGPAARAVRRSR